MVRICALDELPTDRASRFEVEGRRIAVARVGDEVFAIGDFCSHAMVSLSEGDLLPDTCELECWKHGAAFSLRTGDPSGLPATRPVPTYRVTVVDGDVHLDPEELPR